MLRQALQFLSCEAFQEYVKSVESDDFGNNICSVFMEA